MHKCFCLLSSVIEASAVDEEKQVTSSLHNLSSSHWEADVGECTVDMEDENLELAEIPIIPKSLYQPFNFDLKKKSQVAHEHNICFAAVVMFSSDLFDPVFFVLMYLFLEP